MKAGETGGGGERSAGGRVPSAGGLPTRENRLDWTQLCALLSVGIRLDLRRSRAGYGRRRVPPFVLALVLYVVMGSFLSLAIITTRDPFVVSLFTISAAMFMTALSVVMDYAVVVVSPEDYDVIAMRPVSSRTYFWARMANLFFYVGAMAGALAGPAAIVGGRMLPGGAAFGVSFFALALLGCLAAASVVVFVYAAAIRTVSYRRLTTAMTYVHVGATLALTLGYVFLPQLIGGNMRALAVERGAWMYWAPPAWFAGAASYVSGAGLPGDGLLALIAFVASVLVFGVAARTISLDYSRRIGEVATQAPESGADSGAARGAWDRLRGYGIAFCRTEAERAGFELMQASMARDRKLRSRVYPAFGLPIAAYVYGVLTGAFRTPDAAPRDLDVFTILGLYCVFVSFFFTSATAASDQWKASWVFHAAPLPRRSDLMTGARALVLSRYVLPFFALLFVMLVFVMPLAAAVSYWALVFLASLFAFALLSFAAPHFPLSQPVERTGRAGQLGLIAMFGALVAVLMAARRAIAVMPAAAAVVLPALAAAAIVAELALRSRLERRLAGRDFDG